MVVRKISVVLVLLCFCFAENILAQEVVKLNGFEITQDSICPFEIQPGDGEYGFVVINTAMSNLQFSIPDAPKRLAKSEFKSTQQQWILTIVPNDNNYRKYRILINAKGFKTGEIEVRIVQKKTVCFDVNPRDVIKKDSVVEKIVYRDRPKKTFNWEKDFRMILGLSNGIISGEIFGLYGEVGFGEHYGPGIVGGYCLGFNEKYGERWSIGLKYHLKSFYLSTHYGTIMNIYGTTGDDFQMDESGSFYNPNASIYGKYGISSLVGYEHRFGWLHFTLGCGISIPQKYPTTVLFVWNLGLGFSFIDFINGY